MKMQNDIAHLTDEELLRRLRTGDEYAFTEIYNRYWDKLLAIGFYFSDNKQTAEDIVHNVMISLWERRKDVQIISLQSYLATAVKFSVFKMMTREKPTENISVVENVSGISDIEEKLEAKFIEEYTNGVLQTLPEKTQLVFKYSRMQEMPVKEIAGKMNMSGKAVEYHLTKALKSLRDSLRKIKSFFV